MKRILLAAIWVWCALTVSAAAAENKSTDKSPTLQPVPGHVVDHLTATRGIVVNPTPVKMQFTGADTIDVAKGFNLAKVPESLRQDFNGQKANPKGLPVKVAVKARKGAVAGTYTLTLTPARVSIEAVDADGVFYAAGTLQQILTSAAEAKVPVPAMVITDYPAFPFRGVVEGFYGTPWSHDTRLRMLDHMGANKMNSYVFGPKDDPYHNVPHWRQPYPAAEAAKISELCSRAAKNHVNFIWAIHPGGDIHWNREDYDSLLNKFRAMYDLGVRQFAVFFDDISGAGTDSHKQAALLNDLNRDFVQKMPGMRSLIVCPTDYTQSWANPTDSGQLAVYGRELDPDIQVFWTGSAVCSDVKKADRDFVRERIRRPSLTWWNFPVSDYVRTNLLLGPCYNLDTTLTAADMSGILTNPMEQGEASRSAVYCVADYGWNPRAYNALDSWERSIRDLVPGAPEAYRTIAINTTDPQKDFRKIESWEADTFSVDNYTQEQFRALYQQFTQLAMAPMKLIADGDNAELVKEIFPWLEQAAALGSRGILALNLIKTYESGDREAFLRDYNVLNTVNSLQRPGWEAHRVGTQRLQPFIDNVLKDLRNK